MPGPIPLAVSAPKAQFGSLGNYAERPARRCRFKSIRLPAALASGALIWLGWMRLRPYPSATTRAG